MSNILRYHICPEFAEPRLKDLRDYCRRTGCRELLLFSSSYDFQPSFIPLEEYREYAKKLGEWTKTLKDEGITISINVLQTLGHINFPRAMSAQFPFQRRVGSDGTEAGGGVCALCPDLHEYTREVYRVFASLKPRLLYVDDDFRAAMDGALCCFCPQHMERIGVKLDRQISREELVTIMLKQTDFAPSVERMAFHESQVEAFDGLSAVIHKAVAEVSPDTLVGLMTGAVPLKQWGMDYREIAITLAGPNHKPFIRPQISGYGERCDIQHYAGSNRQPAIVRNFVGDDVGLHPEIENYTYTTYSKSARITLQQMAMVHLDGCHEHALNIFDMYNNPLCESEQLIAMLERYRGFLETLSREIPEGSRTSGIACWRHVNGHLYHRAKAEATNLQSALIPDHQAEKYISHLGLPLGFDWQCSPFLLLTGDDVSALKREEMCALLQRNAVLDIRAVECVIAAGLGDMLGIELGEPVSRDESTAEYFEGSDFGTEEMGRYSPLRSVVRDGWCHRITACEGSKLTTLSTVLDAEGRRVGPAVSAVESSAGGRYGIMGFAVDDMLHTAFVHVRRAVQMRNLFEWVAGQALPVVVEGHPYLVPQVVPFNDSTMVLGLSNFSLDQCTSATLKFANGCPQSIHRLTPDGTWLPAEEDFEPIARHSVHLRCSIDTGQVLVYILGR